jgi:hypothetical protein
MGEDDISDDFRVRIAALDNLKEQRRHQLILAGFIAVCVLCGWVVLMGTMERTKVGTICPSLNLRIVPLPGDRSLVFCADGGERE